MKKNVLWAATTLFLLFLGLSVAYGVVERAALVIESKGKNVVSLNGQAGPMRTLQVLPGGAEVEVPKGALLRLTYFQSGRKETVTGPCKIRIGDSSSKRLSGSGELQSQSRRDASTGVDRDENLRRMGGTLHASTLATPEGELALLEGGSSVVVLPGDGGGGSVVSAVVASDAPKAEHRPSPAPAPPQATRRNTTFAYKTSVKSASRVVPFKVRGRSKFYTDAEEAGEFRWEGGPSTVNLMLKQGSRVLAKATVKGRSYRFPARLFKPGGVYTVLLKGKGGSHREGFAMLRQAEIEEYRRLASEITERERYDQRSLLTQLLYLQVDLGLLTEAEKTANKALRTYPGDPGFLLEAGRIAAKLNKPAEARALLRKAAEAQPEAI